MPDHRYSAKDRGAFLDIAEMICKNCQANERIEIALPLKGCAELMSMWQEEQQRLIHKMSFQPQITVSINHAESDFIVVTTEQEAVMNSTIIQNIFSRIKQIDRLKNLIPDENPAAVKQNSEPSKPDFPLNILYSALRDKLVAHYVNLISLNGRGNTSSIIDHVEIWPQSDKARQFIVTNSQYGMALTDGIRSFIKDDKSQWPLLKLAENAVVEWYLEENPEKDASVTDFFIEFKWSCSAQPAAPSQVKPIQSFGKKRLRHPLTITVEDGGPAVLQTITETPWRIGRQVGALTEYSIPGCPHLSGSHLLIEEQADGLAIIDMNSTNGTFIEGRDVRELPGSKYLIKPQSKIVIDLCLGNNQNHVQENAHSTNRARFPRLTIAYAQQGATVNKIGTGTPELDEVNNTPELENVGNG